MKFENSGIMKKGTCVTNLLTKQEKIKIKKLIKNKVKSFDREEIHDMISENEYWGNEHYQYHYEEEGFKFSLDPNKLLEEKMGYIVSYVMPYSMYGYDDTKYHKVKIDIN